MLRSTTVPYIVVENGNILRVHTSSDRKQRHRKLKEHLDMDLVENVMAHLYTEIGD